MNEEFYVFYTDIVTSLFLHEANKIIQVNKNKYINYHCIYSIFINNNSIQPYIMVYSS